jgi:hypothetical protein
MITRRPLTTAELSETTVPASDSAQVPEEPSVDCVTYTMQVTKANVGSVIIAAIPEFRADVDEWDDLDHLQFTELFQWTEASARSGTVDNLSRSIRLVDAMFRDCDAAVKNSVTVSFLEGIDPDDEAGKQIFDALAPALRDQWQALDEYMQRLIGSPCEAVLLGMVIQERSE